MNRPTRNRAQPCDACNGETDAGCGHGESLQDAGVDSHPVCNGGRILPNGLSSLLFDPPARKNGLGKQGDSPLRTFLLPKRDF